MKSFPIKGKMIWWPLVDINIYFLHFQHLSWKQCLKILGIQNQLNKQAFQIKCIYHNKNLSDLYK